MQKGFEQNPKKSPKFWQHLLKIGKVIKVKGQTIDISLMDGSGTYYNVPVLVPMGTTSSGQSHIPDPETPYIEGEEGFDAPILREKRDILAVIGFVDGIGTMPVILGFRYPGKNQLSFTHSAGANFQIDRHESDRYHQITGDTVAENGGEDVSGEEELRYPDDSYFKVIKSGGTRTLTDLSDKNADAENQPFTVKKEDRKGYYFQHSSGTRIYIGHDGEIKIGHHTGSWISVGPDSSELAKENVSIGSLDSKTDPPTAANSDPVKIHVEHSSGSKFTILENGKIEVEGIATVEISGALAAPVKGIVQGDCLCTYTGQPHPMISSNVKGSV